MSRINTGPELRKAIEALVEQAEEAYQRHDDAGAADAYERAAALLERYAENAPSRKIELARKERAVSLVEKAKLLRSGDLARVDASDSGEVTTARNDVRTADRGDGGPTTGGAALRRDGKPDEIHEAVVALLHHSNITWDRIGGLEETKREIKYALGVSLARKPSGVQVASWRNMLFYGPPGTGKTLLAAATSCALKSVAAEKAVFFNVKVSSIMSKYFGESTKIVSELYGTARDMKTSVVFLDEFESLCGSRSEGDTGTERRILSTILSELDGLAEKGRDDIYVLTIAATNRPWDLDPAVLSRFDKKILIPLPDPETRRAILDIHLAKKGFQLDCDPGALVELTEGLSGREIETLAKEVINRMVAAENQEIPELIDQGLDRIRGYAIRVRPLALAEFERARRQVNPVTSPRDMQRYIDWREAAES